MKQFWVNIFGRLFFKPPHPAAGMRVPLAFVTELREWSDGRMEWWHWGSARIPREEVYGTAHPVHFPNVPLMHVNLGTDKQGESQFEELVERAALLKLGPVPPERRLMRIGVSPVVSMKFVALVIEPFRLENPNIDFVFREMNLADMVTLLEGKQLDFVFGPVDATPSSRAAFESVAFHYEPLVFVPSSRTKAKYQRAKSVSLKEIAGETFVMVPDTAA